MINNSSSYPVNSCLVFFLNCFSVVSSFRRIVTPFLRKIVMSRREVRGNLPGLVARLAPRTRSVPADHLILMNRAASDVRRQMEYENRMAMLSDIRNTWRSTTDKMVVNTRIKDMVAKQEAEYERSLDQRRDMLRCLLKEEQEAYLTELFNMQETTEERKMKLRERAHSLKLRKEAERDEAAKRLLEQQFNEQCEELRTFLSERQRKELAADHIEQMQTKQLLKDRERALAAILDPLISGDMIAKPGRDESDAAKKHDLACEAVQVLIHQRKAVEAQKEREKAQIAEDALRLESERKLLAAENAAHYSAQKQKAANFGAQLRNQMRDRLRRAWFEQEQELAAELAETDAAMAANVAEIEGSTSRKRSLMAELQRYREHLQAEKEERAREQAEIERKLADDSEEQWKRRCEVWKRDREARKALLQRVVKERAEQIAIKEAERANRKAGRAEERAQTERVLAELRDSERAAVMRSKQLKDRYASELLGQMDYNARTRYMGEVEKMRERLAGQEALKDYQTKMEAALEKAQGTKSNASIYQDHPFTALQNQNRLPQNLAQIFS